MNILNHNLSAQDTKVSLGNYTVLDTGIYPATVVEVFHYKNSNETDVVILEVDLPEVGKQSFNLYLTSKGNPLTSNGKPMSGLVVFNQLKQAVFASDNAQVTPTALIKKVGENEVEGSVVKQLNGFKVQLGIIKKVENKRQLVNGIYQDTNEKRTFNELSFVLNAEGKTFEEVTLNKESTFMGEWLALHAGKVRDNFKPIAVGFTPNSSTPIGSTAPTASAPKPF